MRLWIDETGTNTIVRRTATIEPEGGGALQTLWFEIDSPAAVPSLTNADPFVCAMLMHCMRRGEAMHVAGPVSRSLLRNLEEFQSAYRAWMPSVWKKIEITADKELDDVAPAAIRNKAIVAMSGGMDGTFSYFRHRSGYQIHRPYEVTAAFLVHGFDSRLKHEEDFSFMRKSVERTIGDDPVALYIIRTNLREAGLVPNWTHAHGTGLAACAHQFGTTHGVGLIGGDFKYSDYPKVWGSSPVTNQLLSSDALRVTYDGAGYSRSEKAVALGTYPAAMAHLSVCHKGAGGTPCCACEKCIRTVLNFRANGLTPPATFAREPTVEDIAKLDFVTVPSVIFAKDIFLTARRNGVTDPWVRALERRIHAAKKPDGPKKEAPESASV